MRQSRTASLVEAAANVVAGYGTALLVQLIAFPVFGFYPTLAENLRIGLIFTAASLLRSYAIRRRFEARRAAQAPVLRALGPATGPGPGGP